MATGKLTALAVEHAHREGQPVMLCDGGGLYFRKQTRDGASWTLRYRFAGRARWMTLGNYPDMSLADARIEAREKRTMLDKQRDPLLEKQAVLEAQRAAVVARRARGTFRELAEDWYDTEIEGQRLKHPQAPRRHLDNYLLPEFGDRAPAEITPADAARLLAKVSKRAPTAANDLLRFMRRVFRFGVRRHLLSSNPVADFDQQDAGGPERRRRRALSRGELEDLFKALRAAPSFGGDNFLALKLLLALGVRKGELLKATWDEFDFEGRPDTGPVWRLPGNRTKTGEPLTIPLEHGVAHFTLHDLRRTMRTHLAALGFRSEVAERCLGHKLSGVEGTYNTHDYLSERRAALESWTAVLLEIERGESKVTPIRRQAAR